MPLKLLNNLFTPRHIQKIQTFLSKTPNPKIVILTGAEISEESGLSPINNNYHVSNNQSFVQNPKHIVDFYNQQRLAILNDSIQPNIAHKKIAELVATFDDVFVITQNIDELHEKADTKNLYKLYGSLFNNKCDSCDHKEFTKDPIDFPNFCINCYDKNKLRPDVVLKDENPHFIKECNNLINSCDLLISIGVDPSIIQKSIGLKKTKAFSISISKSKKQKTLLFDVHLQEKVSKAVASIIDLLIEHNQKL
jgi:NAD-dependent deacetylase